MIRGIYQRLASGIGRHDIVIREIHWKATKTEDLGVQIKVT